MCPWGRSALCGRGWQRWQAAVPSNFTKRLTSLKVLDLSGNNLTAMPDRLNLLSRLQELRLDRNAVRAGAARGGAEWRGRGGGRQVLERAPGMASGCVPSHGIAG